MVLTQANAVQLLPLLGFPRIKAGDNLADLITASLAQNNIRLQAHDIVCVCSKVVSKAEGCYVDLGQIAVSPQAAALAIETQKEPALVELILRETTAISRQRPGVLIVRQRLGLVSANAGIDRSNARPEGAPEQSGPWALTLPRDPDQSARQIWATLKREHIDPLGVIVTDSLGRPFREGSLGAAIGIAGVPAIWDQRGNPDLDGRTMEFTITAFADQVAAAADLVAGQAAEGTPVVLVRGLAWPPQHGTPSAKQLLRDPKLDLYA